MDLELRHHRHAAVLAEHGHYGRAAAALGITQPALSRSIQELERRIGMSLFERSRAGVRETDAGRVFVRRATELLRHADAMTREMSFLGGKTQGELRIGAGVFPSEMFVADAVAALMVDEPGLRISMRTAMVDDLLEELVRSELDVVVGDLRTAEEYHRSASFAEFRITPLRWHRAQVLVRRGHALAGRRGLSSSDVFAYPLAMSTRIPPDLLALVLEGRSRAGSARDERPVPAITCDSAAALRRIVLGSDAVTFMTRNLAEAEIARGELVALDFDAPWLGRAFAIVEPAERPASRAVARFSEFVQRRDAEVAARNAEGSDPRVRVHGEPARERVQRR